MTDRICVVDLSQPIYHAPLERVCAVEVTAYASDADVAAVTHDLAVILPCVCLAGLLIGWATAGLLESAFWRCVHWFERRYEHG